MAFAMPIRLQHTVHKQMNRYLLKADSFDKRHFAQLVIVGKLTSKSSTHLAVSLQVEHSVGV